MQRVLMYFCVIIFACAESVFSAQDISMYPQLKGISLDDVFKGFAFCESEPSVEVDFYKLREFPSKKLDALKDVADFPLSISIAYRKNLKNKSFLLESVKMTRRQNPLCCSVSITYNDKKSAIAHQEMGNGEIVWIFFTDNRLLKGIHTTTLQGIRDMSFDGAGNVTKDEFAKLTDTAEFRKDIQSGIDRMIAAVKESPRYQPVTAKDKPQYILHIPAKTGTDKPFNLLEKIVKHCKAISEGNVLPLMDNELFEIGSSTVYINIREYRGIVRFVSVFVYGNTHKVGFFVDFDEKEHIVCYVAGDIQFDLNVTGETVAKTAKMPPKGSGTKITFHPTGYPATYKTIVKGNLFGRQMEWNDKGEVISDVDLDIPTAQKQPAQKEKPVMRTWTSRGGKYILQAKYISADENQVVLETEKDGEVVVKSSELSDEDRDYVKKQRE